MSATCGMHVLQLARGLLPRSLPRFAPRGCTPSAYRCLSAAVGPAPPSSSLPPSRAPPRRGQMVRVPRTWGARPTGPSTSDTAWALAPVSRPAPDGGRHGSGAPSVSGLSAVRDSDPSLRPRLGRVEMIVGPMFSGKSTELLRRIRRHDVAGRATCVLTPKVDKRYNDEGDLHTHDNIRHEAYAGVELHDMLERIHDVAVVGVDEGHFFADLVQFCEMAANAGKIVLVSCLDGTFERQPFKSVAELIPKADELTKLTAVCAYCGEDAPFTLRTTEDTAVELVGGAEMYRPTCRECHYDRSRT